MRKAMRKRPGGSTRGKPPTKVRHRAQGTG
jgi:hypothetical protein